MFDARRDVKRIQNGERLYDRFSSRVTQRSGGFVESGANETRRRCRVTRQGLQARTRADRLQDDITPLLFGDLARLQMQVVIEVRHVPFEARRISENTQGVIEHLYFTVDDLDHDLLTRGVAHAVVDGSGIGEDADHIHAHDGLSYFFNRFELAKDPSDDFHVGNRLGVIG